MIIYNIGHYRHYITVIWGLVWRSG